MTLLADFAALGRRLEASPAASTSVASWPISSRAVEPDEVALAVAFLTGHPFPTSDSRVLGVRGLPRGVPASGRALR